MHTIQPDESTLHGYFSRERPPILSIDSGESVRYSTFDASWRYVDEATNELVISALKARDPLRGHALCGPVAIRGAKAGMTLEVRVDALEPISRGRTVSGDANLYFIDAIGVDVAELYEVFWSLDAETGMATSMQGYRVHMAPFMGVMGMPPDEPGNHPTPPPRYCGGNMDCKLMVAGSSVFLPISVDGALFSVGDGHAAQGDGEVSGTAIECGMARVDLTFTLHPDLHLTTPRAHTPFGWVTLGLDKDLDTATAIALGAMLDLMEEHLGVSRRDALALASVAVDLRVTQIVNGVQGVHAVLPHDAIQID